METFPSFVKNKPLIFQDTLCLRNPESVDLIIASKDMFVSALFLKYKGKRILPRRIELASPVETYQIRELKINYIGDCP